MVTAIIVTLCVSTIINNVRGCPGQNRTTLHVSCRIQRAVAVVAAAMIVSLCVLSLRQARLRAGVTSMPAAAVDLPPEKHFDPHILVVFKNDLDGPVFIRCKSNTGDENEARIAKRNEHQFTFHSYNHIFWDCAVKTIIEGPDGDDASSYCAQDRTFRAWVNKAHPEYAGPKCEECYWRIKPDGIKLVRPQ